MSFIDRLIKAHTGTTRQLTETERMQSGRQAFSNFVTNELSKDKVFLPGLTEICNSDSKQNITESNQKKFPIFTDNNSRIKKMNNGSGDAYWWWTRSPYYVCSNYFCLVNSNGSNNGYGASNDSGVCFCFCV